jgi:hypothetical protein
MMLRGWRNSVALQAAIAGLALALGVATWTVVRALRVEPIPNPPATTIASLETIRGVAVRSEADIEAAVDNDVFSVDRSAPRSPYRMPGEPDPNARAVAQPEKPVLFGTAVATDGRHFATMQISNGTPTLVHVGDKIGSWTIRSIERGKVTLATADGQRAEVSVSKPGPGF